MNCWLEQDQTSQVGSSYKTAVDAATDESQKERRRRVLPRCLAAGVGAPDDFDFPHLPFDSQLACMSWRAHC